MQCMYCSTNHILDNRSKRCKSNTIYNFYTSTLDSCKLHQSTPHEPDSLAQPYCRWNTEIYHIVSVEVSLQQLTEGSSTTGNTATWTSVIPGNCNQVVANKIIYLSPSHNPSYKYYITINWTCLIIFLVTVIVRDLESHG